MFCGNSGGCLGHPSGHRQGHGCAIFLTGDLNKGVASAFSAQWVLLFCNFQKTAVKNPICAQKDGAGMWSNMTKAEERDQNWQQNTSAALPISEVSLQSIFHYMSSLFWTRNTSEMVQKVLSCQEQGVCDHTATLVSPRVWHRVFPHRAVPVWSDGHLENPSMGDR